MTPYTIPLTNSQQQLSIALGGTIYTLTVYWNTQSNVWTLDIADSAGKDIVLGIALVTGCDLLGQYAYLGLGGSLVVQTDFDPTLPPTYDNLGINGNLYFVTTP